MGCDYCDIAKEKVRSQVVYEDDKVIAVVADLASSPGQVRLFPKEHHTILELMPDSLAHHLFRIANKLSIALFESLGAQGTNIVIQNGTAAGQTIPHFCINIIPRAEGDGLNLQWKPKQLLEEELDTAYLALKDEGDKLVLGKEEKKREVFKDKKTEMVVEKQDEENYLLKQLRRVP
ncbi:MAG: HIT family protein [Candidatus Woesearchaeota archaeon]